MKILLIILAFAFTSGIENDDTSYETQIIAKSKSELAEGIQQVNEHLGTNRASYTLKYEVKYLNEFDYEELTDVDKLYDKKPQREEKDKKSPKKLQFPPLELIFFSNSW